jgi:hypothetical protein
LQVVTTNNYNIIADFHTFQTTTAQQQTLSLLQPAVSSLDASW